METITFFGLDTDRLAAMLKAVGHPVRLEILQTLSAGGADGNAFSATEKQNFLIGLYHFQDFFQRLPVPYYHYDLDWIVTTPNMDPRIRGFEVLSQNESEVTVRTAYGAAPADLEAALAGTRAEDEAFNETNAWTVKPGFAAAWAPWPVLGLTAAANYQWITQETTDSGREDLSGVDLAIAADVDFRKFSPAAITVDAGYHTTIPLGSPGVSRVIDWSGGVYYNGRPELVAGLEVGWRSFTVRDLDSTATLAQIRLARPEWAPASVLDLGAEWTALTGLPMVFALWAGRKEAIAEQKLK